jgi:hypothetical protein
MILVAAIRPRPAPAPSKLTHEGTYRKVQPCNPRKEIQK